MLFGAHTDTSLITMGTVSRNTVPGLELMKFNTKSSNDTNDNTNNDSNDNTNTNTNTNDDNNRWLDVEQKSINILKKRYNDKNSNSNSNDNNDNEEMAVVVFVGELLHLLTKGQYKAAVHRVANNNKSSNNSNDNNNINSDNDDNNNEIRISCPFIIRGRLKSIITHGYHYHHHYYHHHHR